MALLVSIPVIDRDSGGMHGIVTEADLFNLYLSLQSRIADLNGARRNGKRRPTFPGRFPEKGADAGSSLPFQAMVAEDCQQVHSRSKESR